ncbi:MAG: hypothetical protein V4536_08570 [Pseudomonadota bacterium]
MNYDNAEHMMEVLGGGFVRALVELYYRADSTNKLRVKASFSDYFERYEKMYLEHVKTRGEV